MSTIPKAVLETFPKKIYLQTTDEDECEPFPKGSGDVTWCSDKMHTSDVEYLRADLATDGREELEKEMIRLNRIIENIEKEYETLYKALENTDKVMDRVFARVPLKSPLYEDFRRVQHYNKEFLNRTETSGELFKKIIKD